MKLVKRLTMLIFTLWLIVSPVIGATAARVPPLDTTDVMDDLQGLKIGDVAFNEADYPLIDGVEPDLLGIYEYGWGTDFYTLYFYIYNPDVENADRTYYSTVDFNIFLFNDSLDNQPVSFRQWNVEPISQSEDGRLAKYKVDGSRFVSTLTGASTRIYSTEIDMRYYDHLNQDPYSGNDLSVMIDVNSRGETFHFSGSGAAFYQSGETISLDVYPSMYKTDFSPKGDYWHQMIYTAYFTIPSKYVDDYDAITGIEATWEEYHTAPLVVTEDDALLSVLTAMAADKALDDKLLMGQVNHDYGSIVTQYAYNALSAGLSYETMVGFDTINVVGLNGNFRGDLFTAYDVFFLGRKHSAFDTALKVSDMDDFFIPTIGRYYDTDGDGIGDLAATLQGSVDEDKYLGSNTHEFTSEKDIISVDKRFNENWIRSFWNSKWYPDSNDVEATLEPFYYLKDSDMTGYSRTKINENLFIGERFWGAFYDEYAKAKLTGDQVVLFRFALRDYYSAPARYIDGSTYPSTSGMSNCALSYGTAFLDFDVIKLTFSRDAEVYEFMVDADPIDFVPGGDAPNTPGGGIGKAADELLDKILSVLETIVKVVFAAIAAFAVVMVVKWLLDWIAMRRR